MKEDSTGDSNLTVGQELNQIFTKAVNPMYLTQAEIDLVSNDLFDDSYAGRPETRFYVWELSRKAEFARLLLLPNAGILAFQGWAEDNGLKAELVNQTPEAEGVSIIDSSAYIRLTWH